jgi:hypothetical protein
MKRPGRMRARFRLAGRVAAALITLTVFGLVGIQFAHLIGRNLVMLHTLHGVQADIKALRERKRWQERAIVRLSDPAGSIPEIHERLHLVGAHETLIYLRGIRTTSP